MPKIEVFQDRFYSLCGKIFSTAELEDILPCAKGELDEVVADEGILKLELNDTNRPDLWSTAGLARQLKTYLGGGLPRYEFFSRPGSMRDFGGRDVRVDPALKDIRPYIAAFAVEGRPVDEASLKDIIQSQEKLCWNYGRRRRSIAMGVYRSDIMTYPVRYEAADPETTRFKPLGGDRVMNLREINKEHPKGQEFGHIVEGFPKFPFLRDAKGGVLSFPPVINSDDIGAVEIGDTKLFIELTGTEINSLLLATSIVACDFADLGFTVLPVRILYPYDTPYGREMVTPFYFQKPQTVSLREAEKLLGEKFSPEEVKGCLRKMGCVAEVDKDRITLTPPEYRNDFLHGVDITEDIMIGRGMNSFLPVTPADFTVGRLTDAELYGRKATSLMVGLGFQEMIFNYLGSGKDYIEKMNIPGDDIIRISNPMSENFEYVRNSILPCLLQAESMSGNAVYPHAIFEVGKTARLDPADNYGSRTANYLGFLTAAPDAGFNEVNSRVAALLYYLTVEYSLVELEDPRFIPGRGARIMVGSREAGFFGELHPAVLENWNIQMPCTGGELDLDRLRGKNTA
jgi:phenylalanyl-tRNA synthetase beta chain